MKHFYRDIEGRFDFQDVYSAAVKEAPHNAVFVEVGCWQGMSTAYLAVEAINSKKNISIHVVDNFMWTTERLPTPDAVYKQFMENISPVSRVLTVHRQDSIKPLPLKSSSIDFVYIDGSHKRSAVLADIEHYMRYLKPGGVIAGHDYNKTHIDVRIAVAESFGFDYSVVHRSWVHRKRRV